MLYLAIELVSLPSYILTGFRRGDQRASEAALKYVIYGAAASGLMLYGFSLLYGLTGTLCLTEIGPKLVAAADGTFPAQLAIAMAALLSLVGFAFKVAAVPFHAWCPDVYEGAPTPFVAFLSVAPKIAGLAALMRFLCVGFGLHDNIFSPGIFPWQVIIGIISIATMTLGNLAALAQDNIKRMLAYSSIAHAGYLLMGLSVGTEDAMRAIMLYLPIYLLMNMGIFLAVIAIRAHTNSEQISAFRGLGSTNPLLAVSVCIFLFSLVGIPPFAGFIAKFYVFLAAIKTELNFFYVLAAIAVINSVISLFYYARIARAMFFEQPTEERTQTWRVNLISAIIIVLLVIPTILLGIYWVPLAEIIENTGALLGI
jgi:NADH-quinone oxidoreductase subunit N